MTQWLITDLIIERAALSYFSLNEAAFRKIMLDHATESAAFRLLVFLVAGRMSYGDLTYALLLSDRILGTAIISRSQRKFNQIRAALWEKTSENGPLVKLREY